MKRVVLIGIDGAPYTMLRDFMAQGLMPNLASVARTSVFRQMSATIPDNSAVSWSSIMTGVNPGQHGIYGFTDLIPLTYTVRFPNFLNLKHPAFWHQKPDRRSVVLNVPFTYPAQPLNGQLVSGFVSPDLNRSAYPHDFFVTLKNQGYRIDADAGKAYKSKELFFQDLMSVHEKRVALYRDLWEHVPWDTFMVVFTGSDRLEHFFWSEFEDAHEPFHSHFKKYFGMIDEEIGWVCNRMADGDILLMMSDHGMVRIDTEVHLNTYLKQLKLLELSVAKRPSYGNVTANSKAFVLEPNRVYLNLQGKYPNGSVSPNDRAKVVEEIAAAFDSLEYRGERVIESIRLKEELYHGDQTDMAPDLLLIPRKGRSLRGTIGEERVFSNESIISGMHWGEDAFLLVRGDGSDDAVPERPSVEDIVGIMNTLEDK